MAFGPVPVTDPACASYAPIIPVATPTQPAAPQCPLVGIVGAYTLGPGTVYAEFAPTMALDVDEALSTLNNEGIDPQRNSGYRGTAAQAGIPPGGNYPVASPGQSFHNVGLAIDIQLNPATMTGQDIIAAMLGAGLSWGGQWSVPDNIHFQLPPNVSAGGLVVGGKPSPAQVAACQAAHPLGH